MLFTHLWVERLECQKKNSELKIGITVKWVDCRDSDSLKILDASLEKSENVKTTSAQQFG